MSAVSATALGVRLRRNACHEPVQIRRRGEDPRIDFRDHRRLVVAERQDDGVRYCLSAKKPRRQLARAGDHDHAIREPIGHRKVPDFAQLPFWIGPAVLTYPVDGSTCREPEETDSRTHHVV